MKAKTVLSLLSIVISFVVLFEAFTTNIRNHILFYISNVSFYAGYVFLALYIIPIVIVFINFKSLKDNSSKFYPIAIFYATVGLVCSVLTSVRRADLIGHFIAKYHPYIYILPMVIITVSLRKINKTLSALSFLRL
jgi:magnesium-transporting ATPase (P-type)